VSTEIFPTRLIAAADFIDKPLDGFEWSTDPERPYLRVLRRLPSDGSVIVYIGNGRYARDRGYKHDAVWFEVFGIGMGSYGRRLGQFFHLLGKQIERLQGSSDGPIRFVTELGATVTPDGGEDDPEWDADLHMAALSAMQTAPGTTTRFFKAPSDIEEGVVPKRDERASGGGEEVQAS